MSKVLALALALMLCIGLSAAGCYLSRTLVEDVNDPWTNEMTDVINRYMLEQDHSWNRLPEGPERDKAKASWRARYDRELQTVCEKYGKPLPVHLR